MRTLPLIALLALSCLAGPALAQTVPVPVDADSARTSSPPPPNAPGTVNGMVSDLESGRGMPYTNIVFEEILPRGGTSQVGGTMAVGENGQFWATLPPGRYRFTFIYLGYEKHTTAEFDLAPGARLHLDVPLKVKPIEMEMIAVQAAAITNTEFAQLERQRKAAAVQDALSAEQIARSTDSNVAEALERVTGLSVVGGKYVFVRGLGDRYSSTSLNGASLSSPEPNRRTVPLDIFPAAMLDNVVVQKAYTPDMPGEFGGGNIDVRTRQAIDKRQISVKVKAGLSSNLMDDGYYSYSGGRLDWLGHDDGTRALPDAMAPWADSRLPGKKGLFSQDGLPVEELAAIRESFSNVWTPRRQSDPVNSSTSLLYAEGFSMGERTGSILLGGSLSNSYNTRRFTETDFRGGSANDVVPRGQSDAVAGYAETLLGLTAALNFRPTSWSNVTYNWLHTRGSEDKAQTREGRNDQSERFLQHTLTFVERQLDSHVLQGKVHAGPAGSSLHWLGSISQAERSEPDRRFSEFKWTEETLYNEDDEPIGSRGYWGKSPLGFPFVRVFGESDEEDLGAQLSYDWRMPATRWSDQGLKFGWAVRDRDRTTSYRRFGIDCRGCEFDGSGTGENTFDRGMYDDPDVLDRVIITETTRPGDTYDAGHQVNGYFGMADVDVAETFRIVGGARYEESRQFVTVPSQDGDPRSIRLDRDDWLPAANGTWRVTERVNARLGYSRTVNRPEMRELSPFQNFNYETNLEEQGNAFVDQALIDAWDVRLEAYPGVRRYLATSFFWKDFSRPIERILVPQAAGNLKEVPGNGRSGELYGVELEWRGGMNDAAQGAGQIGATSLWAVTRPFWLLGRIPGLSAFGSLAPTHRRVESPEMAAFRNFGITANFSRIFSETEVNRDLIQRQAQMTTNPDSDQPLGELPSDNVVAGPLTGQSSYALNLGVFYGDGSRDASLMLKDFGDRLYAYGTGVVPDIYERVPVTLDFAISQRFAGSLKAKFTVENILDQRREYAYDKQPGSTYTDLEGQVVDDPINRAWTDGRKFSLSLSWAL